MIDYTVERRASRPRLLRLGGVGYVNCWELPPQDRSGSNCDRTSVRSETAEPVEIKSETGVLWNFRRML